jgi:two-component system, NtrC family, response regulator HydG
MSTRQFELGTEALPKRGLSADAAYRLLVIEGVDSGAELLVDGEGTRYLVGSSEACALRLRDRSVSRRHFSATLSGQALLIEDLDSTNGVFVGGVRLLRAELPDQSQLVIGGTVITVERVQASGKGTSKQGSFGRLLGASNAMRRLYPLVEQITASTAAVLIEGEAGTGKELLAEVLHEQGPRREAPFLVCDGSSGNFETQVFGSKMQTGLLAQATGGTLFVRDVCELTCATQERLLAVLQRVAFERVDGSVSEPVDVRVIVSSRKDVDREVQRGRFIEPLALVLARVRVELPPLRVREGDVRVLAEYFWSMLNVEDRVLPPISIRRFEHYRWPGNVGELRDAVVRLGTAGDDDVNPGEVFQSDPKANLGEVAERLLEADLPLIQARTLLGEEFDRRYLQKMLAVHNGNVSRAAGASGIARRYFQTLKSKHGIAGNDG